MPIVSKIMAEEGYFNPYEISDFRDELLEEFLEEELRRCFGVIGSNGCQHLKEQLEEAKKNDPYSFEFLIRQLIRKYVKLAVKVRSAKKLKETTEGPPDRFSELRRKYESLYYQQ
jgi:hypothetical protein